ncbi:MAG: Eco47II family restriction endonuclease [Candidatus Andersenbacteria bacterium]|nr:Eco47II family restriction endonuclease [Candidatus Andersenbacteria bacterium]
MNFVTDEELCLHVKTMVDSVNAAKAKVVENPYSTVIDPFSAVVDASIQHISLEEWMEQEKVRKIQKALQNALGKFHQNILGSMPGWENAGTGGSYDVRNTEKKIIAEIKNKYNTLNSGGFWNMHTTLTGHLDYGGRGFTAYYVPIITETPKAFNKPFSTTRNGIRTPIREDLRTMDGKSFYAMASGDANALANLYRALPDALAHVLREKLPISKSGMYQETLKNMELTDPSVIADATISPFIALFIRAFGS